MAYNMIQEIITTLSEYGQVQYRMTTDGVEFYRTGRLFGKLDNKRLYLLYRTDELSQVPLEYMNDLHPMLSTAYRIAGAG